MNSLEELTIRNCYMYICTGRDEHLIMLVQTAAIMWWHYHSSRNSNPDLIVPLLLLLSGYKTNKKHIWQQTG